MVESYKEAKARHRAWRVAAYAATRAGAIAAGIADPALYLADIDDTALETWRATWVGSHPSGAGDWNWPALVEAQPRKAAVLPIAIWSGADLCGLALGHASRRRASGERHTITLTYVERRPVPPAVPLRGSVIALAVAAAQNYGSMVSARRLRLRYPDRALLGYYGKLGFEVAWKGNKAVYCEQEIRR